MTTPVLQLGRYQTVVREDHPFAYYRMDDTVVGALYDSTGGGHDAVSHVGSPARGQASCLTGAHRPFHGSPPDPPADIYDDFDASTYFGDSSFGSNPQGYYLNNADGKFSTPKWSMEFWLGDLGGSGSRCFYQHDTRMRMEFDGGHIKILFWNGANWILAMDNGGNDFTTQLPAGEHVVITFDGSVFLLYARGLNYGFFDFSDGSIGGSAVSYTAALALPSGLGVNPFFGNKDGNDLLGRVDELAFYDYVLSPERVLVHWHGYPTPAIAAQAVRVRFKGYPSGSPGGSGLALAIPTPVGIQQSDRVGGNPGDIITTFGTAVKPGSTLVLFIGYQAGPSSPVTSVTGCGAIWSRAVQDGLATEGGEMWVGRSATGGTTVTATTTQRIAMTAAEFSGVSGYVVKTNAAVGNTYPVETGAITAVAGRLVVGNTGSFLGVFGDVGTLAETPSTGWVILAEADFANCQTRPGYYMPSVTTTVQYGTETVLDTVDGPSDTYAVIAVIQ